MPRNYYNGGVTFMYKSLTGSSMLSIELVSVRDFPGTYTLNTPSTLRVPVSTSSTNRDDQDQLAPSFLLSHFGISPGNLVHSLPLLIVNYRYKHECANDAASSDPSHIELFATEEEILVR